MKNVMVRMRTNVQAVIRVSTLMISLVLQNVLNLSLPILQLILVKVNKIVNLSIFIKFENIDCQGVCQTCSGSGESECLSCISGYFLFANSTGSYCLLFCPAESRPDRILNKCVTSLVNITTAQSAALVAAPVATSIALTASNVVSGGFSINMMMCLVATESLANMQYLNINHSNIASTIYVGMSASFVPNWIALFNTLEKGLIIFNWGIFEMNQISALFLDNFGDSLTEMIIYLGLFLLALLFTLSSKIEKLIRSVAGKAYVTAFSFLMANMFGKVQSQVLFALMQIVKFNLFFDIYSRLSLFTAIATSSILIGTLTHILFKVLRLFNNQKGLKTKVSRKDHAQIIWLEKKYEFMIGDFKDSTKNQFLFVYWMTAFNAIYILLILCLQSVPVLQCLSIVVLIIAFMMFSIAANPFNKKSSTFSHYFNFSCILVAAILNLSVAIANTVNPEFSQGEALGWAIVSVIGINTTTNTLFSIGAMIYEIVNKILLSRNKKIKELPKLNESKVQMGSSSNQLNQMHLKISKIKPSMSSRSSMGTELNISGTNFLDESKSESNITASGIIRTHESNSPAHNRIQVLHHRSSEKGLILVPKLAHRFCKS